jgi:raffinose/stachyose/melibiose transport system permease protein
MLYKKKWPLIIFLIPGLLMMGIFLYYPFLKNLTNSVYQMSQVVRLKGNTWDYIGFENYKTLLTDPFIRIALKNSFIMMALTVIFEVGLALLFAILVNSIKRGQQIFRTVYFFPVVISASALGLLFKLFYTYDGGMLNQILTHFGQEPVNWLSKSLAFIMISIPTLWAYVGFYFVIILTGICDISEDVYEAAAIDGCTKFKAVFHITLPLLRGVLCTCTTLAVTGALKVFDLPWMLAEKGAPNGATHFLGTYMYQTAFGKGNWDYGSTIALFIVLVGIIVARIVNTILKPDANL